MTLYLNLIAGTTALEKTGSLISPILSAMAFILSSAAFIFTVVIQLKERKRNIRQTLSTALSEMARINVEIARLKKDGDDTPESLSIRKNYNSQRGTLASDADFLITQNKKLITNIDCELMAITYDDLGNNKKSEYYWLHAVKLASNNSQLHVHERDYAAFLFTNNQIDKARKLFEKALKIKMPDTDDDHLQIVYTYLTWARLEHSFKNESECARLTKDAYAQCKNIQHKEKYNHMKQLIDKVAKEKN